MNSSIQTYERVQAEGLNQKQLIVMMYNGISRFLSEAIEAIDKKELALAHEKFDRARKIVFHLLSTLNMEAGEISEKLRSIYLFLIEKITEANMKKDPALAKEIIPVVDNIRHGWESIKLTDESIPKEKRSISGKNNQQVSITA
ncbi:MAG: flagellar export chaperone FliS [candidate division Zixibacteria bacterium]|nr:flagellar export chaperone FliS [candidate division Zixibacteria bacterium]